MNITVKVETWICESCPFRWQFSGEATGSSPYDLTDSQLRQQFPEPQFVGLPAGKCPNCYRMGVLSHLGKEINPEVLSEVIVASDAELEAKQEEEVDADGNAVLERVGESRTIGVVDGQMGVVTQPIYVPKMRSLTTQELAELKEQRDRSLDALESIAVKEV